MIIVTIIIIYTLKSNLSIYKFIFFRINLETVAANVINLLNVTKILTNPLTKRDVVAIIASVANVTNS